MVFHKNLFSRHNRSHCGLISFRTKRHNDSPFSFCRSFPFVSICCRNENEFRFTKRVSGQRKSMDVWMRQKQRNTRTVHIPSGDQENMQAKHNEQKTDPFNWVTENLDYFMLRALTLWAKVTIYSGANRMRVIPIFEMNSVCLTSWRLVPWKSHEKVWNVYLLSSSVADRASIYIHWTNQYSYGSCFIIIIIVDCVVRRFLIFFIKISPEKSFRRSREVRRRNRRETNERMNETRRVKRKQILLFSLSTSSLGRCCERELTIISVHFSVVSKHRVSRKKRYKFLRFFFFFLFSSECNDNGLIISSSWYV